MTYCIPARHIRIIHEQFLKGTVNKRELAKVLKISRNTVRSHLSKLKLFSTQFPDEINNVNGYITFVQPKRKLPEQYLSLLVLFPSVFDSIVNSNSNRRIEWRIYNSKFPDGYCYTQFAFYFLRWLNEHSLKITSRKWGIKSISEKDLLTFKKWRLSTDRKKWEKAVVILDSLKGKTLSGISTKIERSRRKIRRWVKSYEKKGIEGLQNPKRKINKVITQNIETKKTNLVKLIHETPRNFGINRA